MTEVRIDVEAVADLDRMIRALNLPTDARDRVRRSCELLGRFPRSGAELTGRWSGMRCVLGPWRWMLIVYRYRDDADIVEILAVHDSRMSTAAARR